MAYIYIVRCDDDTLYTGITKDINKRIKNHAEGKGPSHAKYMRSHKPVAIAALWQTEEYKVAAKLEYAIKRLKRSDKLRLIGKEAEVHELFGHLDEFTFERVEGVSIEDIIGTPENNSK